MAKILIVDDELKQCILLKKILTSAGHTVYIADNGITGLKLMYSEKINLIISDIIMPEMDGVEFVCKLQEDHKEIPIIAISGNPFGKDYLEYVCELGANAHLEKPIKKNELIDLVDKLLK